MMIETPVEAAVQKLCLNCGICCDGTLFKDVELRPGEDAAALEVLGLKLSSRILGSARKNQDPNSKIRSPKFRQPCTALSECACRIYAGRPAHCREFECALLKAAAAGYIQLPTALKVIHSTRKKADTARALLDALGDTASDVCLSIRFRRVKRILESGSVSREASSQFSRLAKTVHDLNLLLGEYFYPGYSFDRKT